MNDSKFRQPHPYPLTFVPYPPTPNHNPLINEEVQGTLYDVQCVIELLNQFVLHTASFDIGKLTLDRRETWGLQCILQCLGEALNYEMNHRPEPEKPDDLPEKAE